MYRTRFGVVWTGLLLGAAIVVLVGIVNGEGSVHVAVEMVPVLACAIVARRVRHRATATGAVTFGLAWSAAVLVHFTDGLIESHFAFFVVLALVGLLHDWRAIVGATLLVFAHHAIAGTLRLGTVYNHPAAEANPVLWGLVHVAFISGLVAVLFVHWWFSEAEQRATLAALSESMRARAELIEASERFDSMVQNAFDAIALVDGDLMLEYIGGGFHSVFGRDPAEFRGRHVEHLAHLVHEDDREELRRSMFRLSEIDEIQISEVRIQHPDGSWHWVELVGRCLDPEDPSGGIVVNAREITATKVANDLLAHRASHDELTGLPNRTLLVERLDRAVSEAGDSVGLLFLDVDRFKDVNDSLGHEAGDRLLVGVADALTEVVRDVDTVARLGGDEFVILLDGASDSDSLHALGERISQRLKEPLVVGTTRLGASVSIGIALGGGGEDADQLLRNADVAMYQAKQAGRDRIAVFDEEFRLRSEARLEIESALRDVDLGDQLLLHYQPVVDFATRRLHGVEALVRWNHPTRGLLAPADFIPLSEETGLIRSIGEWVLVEACRQSVAWERADGCGVDIAVNVSARQLVDPGFSDLVARVIAETGIDPGRLLLEVTESALVDDPGVAIANLVAIRELGVSAALDDYGTGYASLSYLRTLPLSHIKIDRSFIAGLGRSQDATTIVESTISLAGGLGLQVIAEGIETHDQYRLLDEFGCDLAQGYLLGHPMAAEDLERHQLWTPRFAAARRAPSSVSLDRSHTRTPA